MGICFSGNQPKEEENQKSNECQKENFENFIIAEIYIKEDEVNKDIRIICSYEEYYRTEMYEPLDINKMNEEEIKTCQIQINERAIPFSYFHIFPNAGNYRIKYLFRDNITKTNYMFFQCTSIIKLDFTNFNSKNINEMEAMFCDCLSLIDINISNFNTNNVTNMSHMFHSCKLLSKLNLSNFDTSNVNNMSYMFYECKSLIDLDLSKFNVENVINMSGMFSDCSTLSQLNISNFKIKNNADLYGMFGGCLSLREKNVIYNDKKLIFELIFLYP